MSETPIHDAISKTLQTEGRTGMVTGYVLLAEYIDDDGDHCWYLSHPEDQRLSTSIGQVEWMNIMLRKNANDFLETIAILDDEDD